MSKIERLLTPGSGERPECRCGQEMQLFELRYDTTRRDVEFRTLPSGQRQKNAPVLTLMARPAERCLPVFDMLVVVPTNSA